MQHQKQQNFAIFKRISTAIIFICAGILAVNLWLMHSVNAQQWYQIESEQLGRGLTRQAAKMVAVPMENKQDDLLTYYVEVINQGRFVEGAVIFNKLGERINQPLGMMSVVDIISKKNTAPLVFVEDIVDSNNQVIGYIKLILNREEVTQHHRNFSQGQLSQTAVIIVLTVILSILLTRLFYKFRYRHLIGDEKVL
ncbi:AhpA/YtjB family protein [Glaciecola sp. 1036]|uniref:AhpA/YtjB family protein n=1 Tax=Alteromonadaceae TaxID=72275 RepID=UPI003D02DBDE